jgi:FkbM family methyltransferase
MDDPGHPGGQPVDQRPSGVNFLDRLNQAVAEVQTMPRVRFDASLSDVAAGWIKKKHANGMVHEPGTLAAFWAAHQTREIRTVFDCGALFGYFTLFALTAMDAQVTAFEMHRGALPDLVANVHPYAKVVPYAVSDRCAKNEKVWMSGFNIYEEPAAGWEALALEPGAMKERGEDNRGRGFMRANFITLDAYCHASAGNHYPDLLKIDVEAYQAKAIQGGLGMIQAIQPIIVIELHDPEKIARMHTTNAETIRPLYEMGYKGYWSGNFRDRDAKFEMLLGGDWRPEHDKLSLMVFVP